MKKITFVSQYSKYLKVINEAALTELPTLYSKFVKFLDEECEDSELAAVLKLDSICKTIKAIKKNNFKLKEASVNWNSKVVGSFYDLEKRLSKQDISDDEFKLLTFKALSTAAEQSDTALKLYLYQVHYENSSVGRELFESERSRVNMLFQCKDDLEVDAVLKKNVDAEEKTNERFSCTIPTPKTVLYKLFTPSSLEECEACYSKLEAMADKGEISYDDYSYVKEILLAPTSYRLQHGVSEDSANTSKDYEEMLEEEFEAEFVKTF